MRCWIRVLILFTVALLVANAECFANCLTQLGDSGATHCHQHSPTKSGHCLLQHDLTTSSASAMAPVSGLVALVGLPGLALNPSSQRSSDVFEESPSGLLHKTTPLPLRV